MIPRNQVGPRGFGLAIAHALVAAIAFCGLMMCGAISGAPLITEEFDYTAGDLITAHGWTALSAGRTNPITVTSPGLTYSGYASSGVGLAVSMTTSGEDDNKAFTSTTSGSVYAAFLVTASAASTTGDYFLHFAA